MSFWKSLFGGGARRAAPAAQSIEYKGFTIHPEPYLDAGQYQTAGRIEKEVAGVRKEHRFIRADRFAGFDEAASFTVLKARQLIDQQGESLFG